MNVDIVSETMPLRDLDDGDAFEDRGIYWIKTDFLETEKPDWVGVVGLDTGSFEVWLGSVKVQHMPSLTVGNGDPVAK